VEIVADIVIWNQKNCLRRNRSGHHNTELISRTEETTRHKKHENRVEFTLSCTRYGMVILRWRIVHRQKGRCEDFDYYRSLYVILVSMSYTFRYGSLFSTSPLSQ
jgi:hypothetical protein